MNILLCLILAAAVDMPIDLAVAIARAQLELESTPVSIPTPKPAGGATRPLPVTRTPPAAVDPDSLPADQQPTPMEGVTAALNALGPLAHKRLVVYGSGFDARMEITAALRDRTLTVIGIEIDPVLAASARRYVAHAGLSDRITILTGDATKLNVKADLGIASLFPDTLKQLAPKIRKLERFASFAHDVPGMKLPSNGDIYVYRRPNPQAAAPVYRQQPFAMWGGRTYSGPVCNRAGCSMCNAIRRQLR